MVRGMDSLVSRGLVGVLVAGVDDGKLACDIWCVCMRACILVRCGFGERIEFVWCGCKACIISYDITCVHVHGCRLLSRWDDLLCA